MKKKILSLSTVSLASVILLSNGITYAHANNQVSSVEKYAHMNYDSASSDVKEKIIEARKKIVYENQSWTVNGQVSKINKDGTIEKVPEFKDLFPDWDIDDLTNIKTPKNQIIKESNTILASDIEKYAYMNYDYASNNLKEKIIEARRKIVYGNQSWTVGGQISKINKDGTIEKLPEFKDLYPDWNLKDLTDSKTTANTIVKGDIDNQKSLLSTYFAGNVDIPRSLVGSNTFYKFNANGSTVATYALTLPGTKINLGYTNEDTGQDVGWISNLSKGEGISMKTANGTRYGVRCSTSDVPGKGYIVVESI